jgi:hypothetical protein
MNLDFGKTLRISTRRFRRNLDMRIFPKFLWASQGLNWENLFFGLNSSKMQHNALLAWQHFIMQKVGVTKVHKLLYVVLITSRKLCHYFQAHKISVVTSYPWKVCSTTPNATGSIAKWVVERAEFELDFISCHAVRS